MRSWQQAIAQPRSPQQLLIGAACVLVLAAVVLSVAIRLSAPPASGAQRLTGHPAPALALPAEQSGRLLPSAVSLAPARGHPTLIVFFFSLCPHCHAVVPTVHQLEGAYAARGLRVLYVDSPAENSGIANAYAARMGITSPVLLDASGKAARKFGVAYFPGIVLVDERGIVRAAWTGETPQAALRAAVVALLPA
jgi:thiol-disulfide isomerase/thioredoxin